MHPNERKWEAGRQKVAYALKLLKLLENEDSTREVARVNDAESGLEIAIFHNHKIKVLRSPDGRDEAQWASIAVRLIEPHLGDIYARHFQSFHALESDDNDARKQARLANILGAIGNHIDEIPELRQEIIRLGQMLEAGRDIKSYCLNQSRRT